MVCNGAICVRAKNSPQNRCERARRNALMCFGQVQLLRTIAPGRKGGLRSKRIVEKLIGFTLVQNYYVADGGVALEEVTLMSFNGGHSVASPG